MAVWAQGALWRVPLHLERRKIAPTHWREEYLAVEIVAGQCGRMLLLVCGWPACGKSYFAEWLVTHFDFRHFEIGDAGSSASAAHADLQAAWDQHMPQAPDAFAATLRRRHPRWVLTWSVPPDCLPYLEGLRSTGFEAWFLLPGNEQRSRQEWLQRERELDPAARSTAWERQANVIRKGARDLRRFFRGHCIESLSTQGERMSCEALAEHMGINAVVRSTKDPSGRARSLI